MHVGTRVRAPFHGRTVRGWVVDEDVGTPAGVDVLPAQVVVGLGPTARPGGAGRHGRPGAGPGRPRSFSRSRVPGDHRAHACPRRPPLRPTGGAAPTPGPAHGGRRPGPAAASTVVRQPPLTDPIDLVLSVVGRSGRAAPAAAACWCSSRPSGWAERLTARLVRRGLPPRRELGAGAGRMARRGREPGRRLGSRAPPGGRRRPRRARRGLPGGERPDLQRGGRAGRAGPPGGRALRRRLTRAAGGAGGRHRPADGRRRRGRRSVPAGPSWSGSTAAARTRAAACSPRSSSAWPGRSSTTPRRVERGPLVCVYNRTGRRPPAGLPPLRRAGPVRTLRCRRGAAPRRGGAALPALRRDAPGRVRGLRPAADEDVAGRREPAARGAGGAARRRGGGGGRPAGGGRASRPCPPPPC